MRFVPESIDYLFFEFFELFFDSQALQVYNTVLRQDSVNSPNLFKSFKEKSNFFATTIHVLVSAVVKLSKVTKAPPGLKLYRGLCNSSELPDKFYEVDDLGRRGFVDYGFMSFTSNEQVARQVNFPLQIQNFLCYVLYRICRFLCF